MNIQTPTAKYAIVAKEIPDSYVRCIRPEPSDPVFDTKGEPILMGRARRQHYIYCKALEAAGVELLKLDVNPQLPDSRYVQDPAGVLGTTAVMASMKEPSRQEEINAMRQMLERLNVQIHAIHPPGTLEWGDVVTEPIGKKIYVGVNNRTNESGIQQLQSLIDKAGFEVVPVPIRNVLHLSTIFSNLGTRGGTPTFSVAKGYFDFPLEFKHYDIIQTPEKEAYAANALAVNGVVLTPAGYPKTQKQIIDHGFNIWTIDSSESRKGGGSLTCNSLLLGHEIFRKSESMQVCSDSPKYN